MQHQWVRQRLPVWGCRSQNPSCLWNPFVLQHLVPHPFSETFYLATRGNDVCTGDGPGMLYSDMLHIRCCWGGAKDRQNKIHLMPPVVSLSQVCGVGQILCLLVTILILNSGMGLSLMQRHSNLWEMGSISSFYTPQTGLAQLFRAPNCGHPGLIFTNSVLCQMPLTEVLLGTWVSSRIHCFGFSPRVISSQHRWQRNPCLKQSSQSDTRYATLNAANRLYTSAPPKYPTQLLLFAPPKPGPSCDHEP